MKNQKSKRTITEVLDYETGECIDADIFFEKPFDEIIVFRSRLQQAIENYTDPIFGCYYCKQKVRIRGGIANVNKSKTDMLHFAHLKDSDECHIKTKNKFTKEEVDRIKYNGSKESVLHQTLKEQIALCLRKNEESKNNISSVEVEKVVRNKVDKEWKKPDINAYFNNKRIAIELQLSTTWLDVITKRQHFYKEQGIYIFWIFHTFNENDDLRKLTYNDVIYTNNQNAFIFNKETYELSKTENDLVLKCFYKSYSREYLNIKESWKSEFVKLSDLTFDEQNYRVFFHDSDSQKNNVKKGIIDYKKELQESERLKILEEEEQKKKKNELEKEIQNLKKEIRKTIRAKEDIIYDKITLKNNLSDINNFISNAEKYTEKTIEYFRNKNSFIKPFYDHDQLLEKLKDQFENNIKTATEIIDNKTKENLDLSYRLDNIKKLESIIISGYKYSILSNKDNWDYIKSNFSQIKIIQKHFVDSLFVDEHFKTIKNDYEVNLYQFNKDCYFLTDFSNRVIELDNIIQENHDMIQQQEQNLLLTRKEIQMQIESNFHSQITEIESKINICSDSQNIIEKKINESESKLIKLQLM